ncbi:DNA adenine methylase [Schaalia cardiffensis]
MTEAALRIDSGIDPLEQVSLYPRLRYMGSKYRLLPALADVFTQLNASTAIDPFSGSGVVSYLLKSLGYSVTSSDYLHFPVTLTSAACVNQNDTLSDQEITMISSGVNRDQRDFISRTYEGRFFTSEDLHFLDSAWSHIDCLPSTKKDLAISALVLAAARKQPRGIFTVTGLRYDDGRPQLHTPLREQFITCAHDWNRAVFSARPCRSFQSDALGAAGHADVVYLDPPYAPPRDDNDYIKRYWFLEGLSDYWQNGTAPIMENTRTHKLKKRPTAFGSKLTITAALGELFDQFSDSTLVLSYGSNAVPDLRTLISIMTDVKGSKPELVTIPHRYHMGTHQNANRREAVEYILISD